MKHIYALALAAVLQTSAAFALPLQQSPGIRQQEGSIAAPHTVHPQVYAPRQVVTPPNGVPSELSRRAPVTPTAADIQRRPTADDDFPGIRRVPNVSSLPGMRERPIARHVRAHGVEFDLPAIVVVGAPYDIDIPGLGWVDIAEDEYPDLFAMLTSDDPDQVEAAYERLQELASAESGPYNYAPGQAQAQQTPSAPPCRSRAQTFNVPAEGGGRREVKIIGCSGGGAD
jgi:hypothetical protein